MDLNFLKMDLNTPSSADWLSVEFTHGLGAKTDLNLLKMVTNNIDTSDYLSVQFNHKIFSKIWLQKNYYSSDSLWHYLHIL